MHKVIALAPVFIFLVVHVFCVQMLLCGTGGSGKINRKVDLSSPKVASMVDNSKEKKVYCRCWKSKTFPLCDGSHNEHNAKTGDNVGPLIVKKA